MSAYYNDNDAFVAQWLRNLIARGLIAPGDVDDRDIADVSAADVRGYAQCHWFAGIGVWSYALRAAGWSDERPVWTGSPPCQPFATTGKGRAHEDPRHLWPTWQRLIRECGPAAVLGEQVARGDGRAWLDVVLAGLEDDHYAVAAADLPAAGVGAPHVRQRLFFAAARQLGEPERARLEGLGRHDDRDLQRGRLAQVEARPAGAPSTPHVLADDDGARRLIERAQRLHDQGTRGHDAAGRGAIGGYWADAQWVQCSDGLWRAIEPGTCPLAHRPAARVGRLRAYGNAVVAPVAQAFIEAVMDALP